MWKYRDFATRLLTDYETQLKPKVQMIVVDPDIHLDHMQLPIRSLVIDCVWGLVGRLNKLHQTSGRLPVATENWITRAPDCWEFNRLQLGNWKITHLKSPGERSPMERTSKIGTQMDFIG